MNYTKRDILRHTPYLKAAIFPERNSISMASFFKNGNDLEDLFARVAAPERALSYVYVYYGKSIDLLTNLFCKREIYLEEFGFFDIP
jgi:hypothetical protein